MTFITIDNALKFLEWKLQSLLNAMAPNTDETDLDLALSLLEVRNDQRFNRRDISFNGKRG